MHIFLRRLTLVLAVACVMLPLSTHAQAPDPYGGRTDDIPVAVYTPPAVFADALVLQPGYSRTAIAGSFTALNDDEETVGDLVYRLQLLGPLPAPAEGEAVVADTALLYDSFTSPDVFALAPGTEKNISFSYTPPAVPAGEYRLRAQVVTMHGRELGWADSSLTLTGDGLPYLVLAPIALLSPEYGDQNIPPLSGPNVQPATPLTLQTVGQNTSTVAVSAIPVLNIYEFAATRQNVSTQRLEEILFRPGEQKIFDIPVTTAQKPEAYYATLHFESAGGQRQSSLAEYRWVVRGVSGEIIAAKLAKHGTRATHTIQIDVDTVGAADAEASTTATLAATLTDDQGEVASLQSESFNLTPALQQQTVTFTLERDLVGTPSLELALRDTSGAVLDTYTVAFPLPAAELAALAEQDNGALAAAAAVAKTNLMPLLLLGAVLLVLLVVLLWYMRKGKSGTPPAPTAMTTMAFLFASGLIISVVLVGQHHTALAAQGNGIVIKTADLPYGQVGDDTTPQQVGRWVELFVNQPRHEQQYDPSQRVPLSYRVQWLGCKNQVNHAAVRVRYLAEGGKSSTYAGTWTLIDDKRFTDTDNEGNSCVGVALISNHYCRPERNFSAADGGVLLSALKATALDTTLQFQAAFGTVTDNPDTRNCWFGCTEAVYALDKKNAITHLWLNLLRPTTSPSATPSASPTATPTPTTSVLPSTSPTTSPTPSAGSPQCSDGIDNDNDGGRIDITDPGCHSDGNANNAASYNPADTSEADPECSNNADDDADGVKDSADRGCHTDANANNAASYNPLDPDEQNSECSDGLDNDGDTKLDCSDPGCRTVPGNPNTCTPADDDETDPPLDPGDVSETE